MIPDFFGRILNFEWKLGVALVASRAEKLVLVLNFFPKSISEKNLRKLRGLAGEICATKVYTACN